MMYLTRVCRLGLMGAVLAVLSTFTIAQGIQYSSGLKSDDPDTYAQFPKARK